VSLLSLCAVPITKQKKQIYFSRPVTIHPNFENTLNFATPSELSKTHGTRKPVTTLNHASKFRKYCSVCFENLYSWLSSPRRSFSGTNLSRVVPFFAQLSGTNLPFRVSPKVHSSQPCNLVYFSTRRRFTVAGGRSLKENELPVSCTCTMFQVSATLALRCCSAAASRSR